MKAGSKLRDIQISDEDYLILLQGHIVQLKERCLTIKKHFWNLSYILQFSYCLISELKKGTQREVALCVLPLIGSIKTLLFEYPDIIGICIIKQKCLVFSKYSDKTKVSCMVKTHILFFITLTLFVRILRDICYLLKYAQKELGS